MDAKQENDDNKMTYKKVMLALLVLFLVVGCSEGKTSVDAALVGVGQREKYVGRGV